MMGSSQPGEAGSAVAKISPQAMRIKPIQAGTRWPWYVDHTM
jgi:hypothetical protein